MSDAFGSLQLTSMRDLLETCSPSNTPANVVPFFDGCIWTTTQLPVGVNTCLGVQSCLDCAWFGSFVSSSNASILINGCDLTVNPVWLNNNITVSLVGCNLTVGTTVLDLCTILPNGSFTIDDGTNTTVINLGDTLLVQGIDGMRVILPGPNVDTLQVGLPLNRQHMQVLTWDTNTNQAVWFNNQCCSQTLSLNGNDLCLSGTNCVDLSNIGIQQLQFDPISKLLTITGGNTIDLSAVDRQLLSITEDATSWTLCLSQPAGFPANCVVFNKPAIMDCQDVIDCMEPVIQDLRNDFEAQRQIMIQQINNLQQQIAILQSQI